MYRIQEAARISGVSVRTLHHYDHIGLLSPQKSDNQYRYYSEQDMARLQQILFYKYLGFQLKEIQQMLKKSQQDNVAILTHQLKLLRNEEAKLLTIIDTLEKTIQSAKGECTMTTEQKFEGLKYEDNEAYKQEAIQRYGKEVIEEAIAHQKGKEEIITEGFNRIFFRLAHNKGEGLAVTDDDTQAQVHALLEHLRCYSFNCSLEVFGQIGMGYVADNRFKQTIDQFGEGVAQYTCDAIQHYVTTHI